MESGALYLRPLYKFVGKHKSQCENVDGISVPSAYRIFRTSNLGSEYCKLCHQIVSPETGGFTKVPEEQGFYLWGFYNPSRFWVNVYVGKAGKKATGKYANLNWRLEEELKDERAFLWREFYSKDKVMGFAPKYREKVKLALGKAGSTHIFWVSKPVADLKSDDIEAVENDLIEAMNPTGNRQRRKPSAHVQKDAGQILNIFRAMIHVEREKPTSRHRLDYHDEFWQNVGEVKPTAP